MPDEPENAKPKPIVIYIENDQIWPEIKACDETPIDVIVVNNDRVAIWRPRIIYNCNGEIEQIAQLADELQTDVDYVEKVVKKVEK